MSKKKDEFSAEKNFIIVDENTGESFGKYIPKQPKKRVNSPKFIMLFPGELDHSITPQMQRILILMDQNNEIRPTEEVLRRIAYSHKKWTVNQLRITLSRMLKQNLLTKLGYNWYMANPKYFFKTSLYQLDNLSNRFMSALLINQKERQEKLKAKNTSIVKEPENIYSIKATK